MMPTIDIHAIHQMSHADACDAADELAGDLARKFGIDYGWDGHVIHFERPGANGSIRVGQNDIHVTAQLGFILMMLRNRIEDEIRHYLENHFGCTFER
jgi:putative polyhydroxyalkanoate system protein